MRATGHDGDGGNRPGRQDDRVGGGAIETIDDFLDGDESAGRGEDRLLLHADDALDEHVAGAIGLLGVDDGHVRPMRGHRSQRLTGERTRHELDARIDLRQLGSEIPAEKRGRHAGGARGVGVGHRRMAVFFDLERPRPALLDGVAQSMQRANARIAAP